MCLSSYFEGRKHMSNKEILEIFGEYDKAVAEIKESLKKSDSMSGSMEWCFYREDYDEITEEMEKCFNGENYFSICISWDLEIDKEEYGKGDKVIDLNNDMKFTISFTENGADLCLVMDNEIIKQNSVTEDDLFRVLRKLL